METTDRQPELPDVAIEIVDAEEGGQKTVDPLGREFYADSWAWDCPEDLSLMRDIGGWVYAVNSLRLAPEMAEAIRALDHAWGFEDKAAEQAAEAALVSVSQKLHAIGGGPDAG